MICFYVYNLLPLNINHGLVYNKGKSIEFWNVHVGWKKTRCWRLINRENVSLDTIYKKMRDEG
jgi:hypothetical protein